MTTAVVFPGQGSQRAGMASAWDGHPAAATFDEVGRACGIRDLARLADDPAACATTAVAQPAIFAAGLAAWRALSDVGVEPAVVAGHSLGEFTAATAAGALDPADAAALVGERARACATACERSPGSMAAVLGLDAADVRTAIGAMDGVSIANDNAPGQVVIAGELDALANAVERCREAGGRVRSLDVEGAFHTAAMASAVVRIAAAVRRSTPRDPAIALIRGSDAELATTGSEVARGLIDGTLATVRWREVQERLPTLGIRTVIEAGPGGVLRGLARRTVPDAEAVAVDGPESLAAVAREQVGAR